MSMHDLFPGYNERTQEELSRLWKEGIFVVDTNMLLNVYRYSPETRDRYLETLSRLKSRLWIPYQVAYEYQDRRAVVIREQVKAYENVVQLLDTTLTKAQKFAGSIQTKACIHRSSEADRRDHDSGNDGKIYCTKSEECSS
jgi:PIN like domain